MPVHREPVYTAKTWFVDPRKVLEETPSFLLRMLVAAAPLISVVFLSRELGAPSFGWVVLVGAPFVALGAGFGTDRPRDAARIGVVTALILIVFATLVSLVIASG